MEAFGCLVRRYQGLVFGVAFHALGNVEDARDVAQDVFVRAFVHFDQLRDPRRFGSWLRQIAVNECRVQRRRLVPTISLDEIVLAAEPPDADDRILIAAALRSVDEKSRLTLILYYLHAQSVAEIGAFLDEPTTTIKSRLRNARAKMRRELETVLEGNLNTHSLPEGFADRIVELLNAVKAGDEGRTRALLKADPRLARESCESGGFTALHIASASGDTALVELLLKYGADPNALDTGDNASPLHHAAERNRLDVVKMLVEAGSDVNWDLDLHQRGPLGWALVFNPDNRVDVAEYLISKGARLDIFSAIALDRPDAIREIVAREPQQLRARMSRFEYFRSPIEFATARRKFSVAELLVELGADLTMAEAAGLGRIDLIEHRLAEAPHRFARNLALQAAVMAGQVAAARRLIEDGADPNFAPQVTSLLFDSIGANDEPISRLLVDMGADLEFKDRVHHSSPLGWQVFFGNPETTQLAIHLGAEVTPNLVGLAEAGERGELRRWRAGRPDGYRRTAEILRRSVRT